MKFSEELMKRKKDELSDLASFYELEGAYKLKKKELCEALAEQIAGHLNRIMNLLDDDQMDAFEHIMQEGYALNDEYSQVVFMFLESSGVLHFEEDGDPNTTIFIPEEVLTGYDRLCKDKMALRIIESNRERHKKWRAYKKACINLYGVMEIGEFLKLYKHYEKPVHENHEILDWLYQDTFIDLSSAIVENYMVHESLYFTGKEHIHELLNSIKGKKRYIPQEKEELLRYQDPFYEESSLYLERLKGYLRKNYKVGEENIEDAMDFLISMQRGSLLPTDLLMSQVLVQWGTLGIQLKDIEAIHKLMEVVMPVLEHTRIWANKGFRPSELSAEE